ncbi:LLM class oxidoreductase [Colwellia sp. RE-S-Sl-9]
MQSSIEQMDFDSVNRGYNRIFKPNRLSIGLVIPIENYADSNVPTMEDHIERIQLAESLGFASIWLRDVPFDVPTFGDAGQIFDPFVYLGLLSGITTNITLGVSSIVLPIRHPVHVAKAAASADVFSKGRLVLGVASGDRPEEYPALNESFDDRGYRFRESFTYINQMWQDKPQFDNHYGQLNGSMNMLPKPLSKKLPLIVTGSSQQNMSWIAENSYGWMTYPRKLEDQSHVINSWQQKVKEAGRTAQPVMQPLYLDLADDPDFPPTPIHLGFRIGTRHLITYLTSLENIGVNHVALNLRFNQLNISATLKRIADEVLPNFTA